MPYMWVEQIYSSHIRCKVLLSNKLINCAQRYYRYFLYANIRYSLRKHYSFAFVLHEWHVYSMLFLLIQSAMCTLALRQFLMQTTAQQRHPHNDAVHPKMMWGSHRRRYAGKINTWKPKKSTIKPAMSGSVPSAWVKPSKFDRQI